MPGQEKPATTLAVMRTGAGWYLEDVPEAKVPQLSRIELLPRW